MQSSSQPAKPRRFDATKRSGPKSHTSPALPKEDKNMNTIPNPSSRRVTKTPVASPRTRVAAQPRAPLYQPKASAPKAASSAAFKPIKPKAKSTRMTAANRLSPSPASPAVPSLLPLLDPNCNEPSLPCLCCDGRSPQDNNSMFNHNHNNNNTISLRQQMQLPAPPGPLFQKQEDIRGVQEEQPHLAPKEPEIEDSVVADRENKSNNNNDVDVANNAVKVDEEEDDDSSGDIDIEEDHDDDEDDDTDDDTLVPSCCDCPPSLLDFSLSSSTSSSSTSISSCSDLDSDSADQSYSMSSSNDQDNLSFMLSPKACSPLKLLESKPPARSPPSLPLPHNPFYLSSHSPSSPDEGYPSALDSPDYLGIKEDSEMSKLSLLDFLESVGEFGKMERFSQVIQVARWDLEGEQHWDVLRDRIDHLDRLEKVNREVKLTYIAKLHEKGFDLSDLEEQDLSDIMDEMGNIDIPWKLYRNPKGKMQDSQEFSDAGVDLTAPSDCEDPLAPDSLTPSPIEAPPKPPVRHASVTSDLHTYININREPSSVMPTSPTPLSTFSLHTTSPTFTTFKCEKSTPVTPPSIPPLPASKPVPYLTLYTAPSPTIPTPTPPIPPPRTRHLARKEAQRRAALLAEQEKSPTSLPPPTTRPPPLPPPPVISISSSSPPAIPPPPALPPPPSFHALDVEIRKLLMLAGLTQAELLKLSPELGVCVGGLEDEEDAENIASRCEYTIESRVQEKDGDKTLMEGLYYRDILNEETEESKEERKETQRTTSFSEMARRRRKNTAYYMSEPYYSTGLSNTNDSQEDNFEILRYTSHIPGSPPPPPPPRPLPPIPSCAPPKVSTLPANSAQPERFDWLIAFTPDSDADPKAPLFEIRKRSVETPKKASSSSSKPSTGSAPKVTTFKELRNRKSNSPPTKLITAPEPDPNVITPDPDLLYNLKWRRDKTGGDGPQWEYTSQAQALFMQPPPALTSMAALKEMLQRAEEEAAKSQLCPSQKLGYSVSDSSLWHLSGTEWEQENFKKEEKKPEGEGVEVRGQADGERSTELRTSASSPPPPLAQSSLPYFLHSADQPSCPNFGNPFLDPRPHNPVGQKDPEKLQIGPWDDATSAACVYRQDCSIDKLFESLDDFGIDSICDYRDYDKENMYDQTSVGSNSTCNVDSLYCTESTPAASVCPTPYKNIDAIIRYNSSSESEKPCQIPHRRVSKELPPLPTFYLYHPKNCPLHRGAPPRLSPIGALSPPQRSEPPPGAPQSGLSSPLFPRSHTLPALAAPLYYPNLYPPVPPRAPLLPPKKLYEEQSHVATVRSVSFAGSVYRGEACMAEDARCPVRGPGLSPLRLQEKRALVSAVSVAVEAILAQFSTSRTIVQKALSGDSTVNPSLGRLVLQCLCPALHSLLTDGLKPHQSDLIAGRRPNSAWSLVQASTRPGSKTQALFNLQTRVGELPQLKQSKHRFNAFILGLLNIKHLDFWLSHLHACSDVLDTYYHPSSFMRLSLSVCRPQFDELLLVLQPLSLLTFNLDLLFQHHHWDPHSPKIPKAPVCQDAALPNTNQARPPKKSEEKYMESLTEEDIQSGENGTDPKTENSPSESKEDDLLETSPQLRWVKEKEISSLPPPDLEEDSLAQQAGQVIQQGWEVMMRWGGRLSQNLSELSLAAVKKDELKDELKTEDLQAPSDFVPVSISSGVQIPWGLERLFGAPKSLTSPNNHPAPTRRPSQWLAPSVSVLTRMVSSSTAPNLKRVPEGSAKTVPEPHEKEEQAQKTNNQPRPLRSVRTLCDHRGSGSELSFCKGEELEVLGGVDQDWIRCRRGDAEGLVPIGYTSLIM